MASALPLSECVLLLSRAAVVPRGAGAHAMGVTRALHQQRNCVRQMACLSDIEIELSIRNSRSICRLPSDGSRRRRCCCLGTAGATGRSRQPAVRAAPPTVRPARRTCSQQRPGAAFGLARLTLQASLEELLAWTENRQVRLGRATRGIELLGAAPSRREMACGGGEVKGRERLVNAAKPQEQRANRTVHGPGAEQTLCQTGRPGYAEPAGGWQPCCSRAG